MKAYEIVTEFLVLIMLAWYDTKWASQTHIHKHAHTRTHMHTHAHTIC